MQARRILLDELAEAHDNAELVRIDAEGKCLPGDDGAGNDGNEEQQRAGDAAAVHDLLDLVLAPFQHLLEIGRLSATAGALAPRPTAVAAAALPAAAATLIVPGHL